jgi:hypothetical protein
VAQAAQLAQPKMSAGDVPSERTLEWFLEFKDDDLAANRAGSLSPGQAARLLWSGIWRLVVGPILLQGGLIVALLVNLALVAVIALGVAAYGLYLTWHGFAFLVDRVDGAVAYTTAPLRRRLVRTKNGYQYFAHIGPVTKSLSMTAYHGLPEGLNCHLYYSPGCRSLLSTEAVTADEPKPAHPFGPDSAHAWDRVRWSWVLMSIGVLGILIGAHAVVAAHPAYLVRVGGTISSYSETHGKSTSRYLYLQGDPAAYTPQSEDTYSPPAPDFYSLTGKEVVLYINSGTRDILALSDGDQLYAADWYLHPEHQTVYEATNGSATGGVSLVAILTGLGVLVFGRRRAINAAGDPITPPPLFVPPTVRSAQAFLPAAVVLGVILALAFLGLFVGLRA